MTEASNHYIIYKFTNKFNNFSYIGQTKHSLLKRFKQHVRRARKGEGIKNSFQQAIRDYGEDAFLHEILEEGYGTKEYINGREIHFIEKFKTYFYESNIGYNLTMGGEICFTSDAKKEWYKTEKGKQRIIQHSEFQKEWAKTEKGRKHYQDIAEKQKGKTKINNNINSRFRAIILTPSNIQIRIDGDFFVHFPGQKNLMAALIVALKKNLPPGPRSKYYGYRVYPIDADINTHIFKEREWFPLRCKIISPDGVEYYIDGNINQIFKENYPFVNAIKQHFYNKTQPKEKSQYYGWTIHHIIDDIS